MDPNLVPAPTAPPADQPMRAEVRSDNWSLRGMQNSLNTLLKGRPGWYQNIDEQQWFFYPNRINEPISDQTTTFSDIEYILPQETVQIDAYLAPMYQELQTVLHAQPEWHYDDAEKGWVYQSPLQPGFIPKLKRFFGR